MAIGRSLSSKLTSVFKKKMMMNSFSNNNNKLNQHNNTGSSSSSSASTINDHIEQQQPNSNLQTTTTTATVYVGKSRREYQVPVDLLHHPVIRELVIGTSSSSDSEVIIGCEVVLFDHLCWTLDQNSNQIDDQLAAYYAY